MKDTRDMMVKDYDTCTDEELIARLRAGEREITDYLIDKYKSLVRTRARALYLVGGDHEDLIQEGMLGLLRQCVTTNRGRRHRLPPSPACASIVRCILQWHRPSARSISR